MPVFEIFELQASRGTLGICQMPGKTGDYGADLQVIEAWAPTLTISVVQSAELTAAGAHRIEANLAETGGRWRQLPVQDFGVPNQVAQEVWSEIAKDAIEVLDAGGRVLAHCQGGCGRSGMVLMHLMTMLGEAPDAALKRLRAVRPCAVETDAQMAWAAVGEAI